MILMAEAYGADIRLVAFMQYLRVVMVALVASAVARIWAPAAAQVSTHWLGSVAILPFVETLAVAAVAGLVGGRLRIPAGALLVPMVTATLLQDVAGMTIALPPLVLALCYAIVGWTIGQRFTREILKAAVGAMPRVILSILALIAACGLFAAGLVAFAGVDPLTAYLATSPGGADSVAIIGASSKVDMPFIMALQVARFVLVLVVGPSLARFIATRIAPEDGMRASSSAGRDLG